MLDRQSLTEFYTHVYPVELVVQWLTYDFDSLNDTGLRKDLINEVTSKPNLSGYLSRREFCFTLIGDVFTRFRSYSSAAELRAELVKSFPEKIDVGAVYNIRPSQKQSIASVYPVERELVFDIDMSDYDNVRSCCSGKSICQYCWAWMSCAAMTLRYLLQEDFGFSHILPVFSGRRGVHLWVCDQRARAMTDDERSALVGYCTVVAPKTMRSSVVADLANHRPIHPTIRRVRAACMDDEFRRLFVDSAEENPNNIQHHPKAAAIVYEAALTVLKQGRPEARKKFLSKVNYTEGGVLDWLNFRTALGDREGDHILFAIQLLLMYPRLDENVTTRRDHLLKLPFCIHPGTSSLCCPLEWDTIAAFDPLKDPPKLEELLLERHISEKWLHPLTTLIEGMAHGKKEDYSFFFFSFLLFHSVCSQVSSSCWYSPLPTLFRRMFLYSPRKLMRTQKLHSRLPYSNEEATNPDFLLIGGEVGGISGMGMHSCWIADRRSKFLQLWPYGPLYRDGPTLPMLVGLPKSLQECSESERIYTSEIGGADNGNIAFCTSRGAVTSTDHRLYLQLLHPEDTERKEIVCFACKNVGRESERLILVVGTSDGDMIVTLKTRNGLYSEQISLAEKCEPQAILVPRAFSWKSWLPLPRKADRAPSPSHLSAGSPCRIVSVRKNSSEILSASEAIVCSFNFEFSSDQLRLNKRWSTNVLLGQSGAVLSIGECPGKVCVLLTAADSVGSSYSLLSLAVLNDRNGSFMHHISLSGNTTLIRSLDSVPLSHIKTFVFEGHSEITICCGNMILHAKNAENASNTPEAERVTVLNNLVGGVTSVVLDSGAIVSLDAQGPHLTVENVFHENELAGKAKGGEKLTFCGAKGPRGSSDFDRQLEELIAIAKVDSRTSLDDLILSTSETLFPGTAKKATGLWALSDMNDESDNILLRATINLKRGQQAHRCFLLAVLRHPQLLSSLRPETLGELISAQESLLVLSSLRALQNIGLLPESDGLAFSTLEMTHQIFGVSLFGSSTGRAMKVPLIQRQEQLLCCQKILRASLIRVAERHRSEGERGQPSADLVYSHPVFAVAMLEEVKAFLEECHQSALLTTQEKRLTAYAAACILVIACQTVVESREDIYRVWVMSREVSCHMWSDSETSKWSIKGLLGETAVLIARMSDGNKQTHDLLFFILFFICASHAPTKTKQTLSQLIKNTLLSFPFVESAFGYPLGPPKPTARYAAIGPQIIEAAETLALTFDIFDLLMDFSLSSPLSHSCIPESTFSLFVEYCKTNERFFSFALESLLLQKREWEVIYLPLAVSSQYPQARALGCQFLSERAPHLLWLVDSNRFDSLLYDGANPAPAVLYGPHQLSHRSRCTALAKLMHAAEGCPPSVFSGELEVSKSIVKAQEMYLMSSSANEVLGAQEVVQRLIALPSSVKAWVHAAQTASLLRDELSEDLLVQVLKRCKQEDGESLELFDSASERDTSIQLLQTASGQVIVNCRALQSISLLQRLGQQVYTKQELQLLLDWVEALFTGRASFHGGKH